MNHPIPTPLFNLKEKVRALTAHIKRSEIDFLKDLNRLEEDEVKTLAIILYKELMSVIQAVEED